MPFKVLAMALFLGLDLDLDLDSWSLTVIDLRCYPAYFLTVLMQQAVGMAFLHWSSEPQLSIT